MLRQCAWIAAASSALWLTAASALGLGDIEVKSKLNQRFSGYIPVTSIAADEAENLLINLASNEDFVRAGLERSEYVSSLKFEVKTDGAEGPRIEVRSAQIAREPFVNFMLDVRAKSGRILREYTILLDPPELNAPVKPAPVPKPVTPEFYETVEEASHRVAPPPAPSPVQPQPLPPPEAIPGFEPAAPETPAEPPPSIATGESYGPVQGKETLWSLASKLRTDPSISMDQVMLALYQANPEAFAGGISGLRKGSVLRVPTADEQRAVSPAEAKTRVSELRGLPQAPRAPKQAKAVSKPPPPAPVEEPELLPTPAPAEKKTEPVAAAPIAPKPAPAAAPVTPTPPPAAVETPPTPGPQSPPVPASSAAAPSAAAPAAPAEAAPQPESPVAETPEPESPASSTPPIPASAAEIIAEDDGAGPLDILLGPLGAVLAILLLAAGGWWWWKNKKTSASHSDVKETSRAASRVEELPSAPKAAVKASSKDALEKLSQTLDVEPEPVALPPPAALRTKPVAVAEVSATQKVDAAMAATAQLPAQKIPQSAADFNATQIMEAPLAQTQTPDKVDFDVTAQFETDTMSINLDTNDPVAEADFHLAYGLYDEAALLLQQHADKDPSNTAVRVKLAEVYYTAGKAAEFQRTAEAVKPQLDPAAWSKLAIMGQQLCPDAALFQDAGDGDLGSAVDLSFDEPAAAETDHDKTNSPAPGGATLEFKLDELQLPDPVQSAAPSSGGMDFTLNAPALELDAKQFDLTAAFEAKPAPAASGPSFLDAGEIRLEDFDLGGAAEPAAEMNANDPAMKLDLARAYVDIGDSEGARALLNEVLAAGDGAQKKEAETLIARLT